MRSRRTISPSSLPGSSATVSAARAIVVEARGLPTRESGLEALVLCSTCCEAARVAAKRLSRSGRDQVEEGTCPSAHLAPAPAASARHDDAAARRVRSACGADMAALLRLGQG